MSCQGLRGESAGAPSEGCDCLESVVEDSSPGLFANAPGVSSSDLENSAPGEHSVPGPFASLSAVAGAEGIPGPVGAVLVVGGGIGGMQAALDLAQAGFRVTLVERQSAIGGHMAQLDKTFPTNDCSMCTLSPKLLEVAKHRNIELLTQTEVLAVEGRAGRFQVQLRIQPRYVLLDKCNACGDCLALCPVELPNEFDQGLSSRKAIHKLYPQAIPGAMTISKQSRPACVHSCPAGVNCQGYVALVAQGRFAEAYALIRQQNPFPAVCGRICHHPCEQNCRRSELDDPVAINPLKRFVADWVFQQRRDGQPVAPPETAPAERRLGRVAIVGGGPAGLTAARDLALWGYSVTLFEAAEKLGGTMRSAIPAYRLPEEVLDRDIEEILAAGFELRLGQALGRDFSLQDLRQEGFQAVFLALGCTRPVPLRTNTEGHPLDGQDLEGVLLGLDFLQQVKRTGQPRLAGRVVVIGGGNVAIDVAMCARRQGAQQVEIVCLERPEEMPAHRWEVLEALEEGIRIRPGWGVYRVLGFGGRVTGLLLQECLTVFDAQRRFSPRFGPGRQEIDADFVLIAIGQQPDLSFLPEDSPLWSADRRRVAADPFTLQTPLGWVFAGGDLVTGPSSVVEAVAQGHRAAESIHRFLQGEDMQAYRAALVEKAKSKSEPAPRPDGWFVRQERVRPARLPVAQRHAYQEIEQTISAQQAVQEARRCLRCGLCSECQECVKVCKAGAIVHQMLPEQRCIEVGAVVLAVGFEPMPGNIRPEYGYGIYPNVVTSLEFERILSASGPFQGHVRRPSDGRQPRRIAWIQCVGSRDLQLGHDYCSSVCCMYALKEAMMAVDHLPGLEAVIFANDIRAFGKGFEGYYLAAQRQYGVRVVRGLPSTVKQRPRTGNLLVGYVDDSGRLVEEEFDMVVLSVGLRPPAHTSELARRLGIQLDRIGFCQTPPGQWYRTNREGIFVVGAFAAPMDIPETVISASAAAACVGELLHSARGTLVRKKEFPPERDVSAEPPRIGVFVCRCGANIARVVDTQAVVRYARRLPGVVYAEENLYTCSTDTQHRIIQAIEEHRLNRVVVASCSPRTHEPLFQETLREAGLNRHLFEMANIRDQCSWVHGRWPEQATEKAKDLVRMAVARAGRLRPLAEQQVPIEKRALVLGGGVAGLTAALSLADQGFPVVLVENQLHLGGLARQLRSTLDGLNVPKFLAELVQKVQHHPNIQLYLGARLEQFGGHVGQFRAVIRHSGPAPNFQSNQPIDPGWSSDQGAATQHDGHSGGGRLASAANDRVELVVGAVILATGGAAYQPSEYGYGKAGLMTQLELEELLAYRPEQVRQWRQVVMIQCIGSRTPEAPFCSRVCCNQAVKNALALLELNPQLRIYVLHRDVRTYGFYERAYQKAREAGVVFLRFSVDQPPQVEPLFGGCGQTAAGQTSSAGLVVGPLEAIAGCSQVDTAGASGRVSWQDPAQADPPWNSPQGRKGTVSNRLVVRVYEEALQQMVELRPDCVVLSAGVRPGPSAQELSQLLKVPLTADGFFLEAHMKLRPLDVATEGIFLAGLAHGPKMLSEAILQAKAAASRAASLLAQDRLQRSSIVSQVDPSRCAACLTCVRLCPFDVPRITEQGVAYIEPAQCQGCGLCASACPRKAIQTHHYEDEQLLAKLAALWADSTMAENLELLTN
ncbi:MAG: FAD-dependent oxidoreductase [Thermoguttaceae bacterium]|nr:FAD-dependent oxidoreductase [Thermoguttaceae bacterium]MDW8036694.1 FAD-dependent oxidoreductase [Thermoguttaceae bacterium]